MKSLCILLFCVQFWGCSTVPVTGRKSLSLVPESEVNSLASNSYDELIKKSKLADDTEEGELVRRVGQRIAAVSDQKDFKWEYHLIDEPKTVNAFCMPGGKVAFYTGIMPVAKTEAGVAVVMGHEVAHAIARHGSERLSQQLVIGLGGLTLAQAVKSKPAETQKLANMAFGLGVGLGYVLPYGRKQESEADRIGLIYMARAGYDPAEAVEFWKRMDA
ncbi:MAG: peptidase M48, partial [Elusimicrobia bacterium RIFCSPLOWO2_01_FULL_54_10]